MWLKNATPQMWLSYLTLTWAMLDKGAAGLLNATETPQELILANDRLYASVNKSIGAIYQLTLDGQDLLGNFALQPGPTDQSTGSGQIGVGPYLDCYCTPSGSYTPGYINPKYRLIKGVDSHNVPYGGIVMNETYPATGQVLEQYWFLREGETGLHTFSRIAYHNKTTPFLRNLQEFRTLFRPNSDIWTHLSTNEIQYAPNPPAAVLSQAKVVQDATWYLGNFTNQPYVEEEADYFTKYTFADVYRDHDVHGLYADGSQTTKNNTFGAWLVMNTKDTYYGGPLRNDLIVDGIVYNYIVSNHYGAPTPNITDGFDRTFGPFYYHFNKGRPGTSLQVMRRDALKYYSPSWNAAFYDSIAPVVKNYVPTDGRGGFKAKVHLPRGAKRPLAILSQNGTDFQDNASDQSAFQYWADIDPWTGEVRISRVKAGTYRLTVYADGIFGQYTQDNVVIKPCEERYISNLQWTAESAGTEIWRVGVPDRSSGEYKHGTMRDLSHPNHPEQFRIFWPVYDYPTEFPHGVNFEIGRSKEENDFNYIHWSVFGGPANPLRPVGDLLSRFAR
jgi:rhamnogalacturonan endolyase